MGRDPGGVGAAEQVRVTQPFRDPDRLFVELGKTPELVGVVDRYRDPKGLVSLLGNEQRIRLKGERETPLDVFDPRSIREKHSPSSEIYKRVGARLGQIERFCDRQRLPRAFNGGLVLTLVRSVACDTAP